MKRTHLFVTISVLLFILVAIALFLTPQYEANEEKSKDTTTYGSLTNKKRTDRTTHSEADLESLIAEKVASGEKDLRTYLNILRQHVMLKKTEELHSHSSDGKETYRAKKNPFAHPEKYKITKLSSKSVVLDLDGNEYKYNSKQNIGDDEKSIMSRIIHGRVLQRNGDPVAEVPVLVGDKFYSQFSYISANYGISTDNRGFYSLYVESNTGYAIIAFHPTLGWSLPVTIQPGSDPLEIDLLIPTPGAIEGTVTRNGKPECAKISLDLSNENLLHITQESENSSGIYRFANLPPGVYTMNFSLCVGPMGGSSTPLFKSIELQEGQTAKVDMELPYGCIIAVDTVFPDSWPPRFIEYFLLKGAFNIEHIDLNRILEATPRENMQYTMFGGDPKDTTMQFQDIAPGDYTLCAKGTSQDRKYSRQKCQVVSVYEYSNVIEVTLSLNKT